MAAVSAPLAPSPAAQQLPATLKATAPDPQRAVMKHVPAFVSEQDELERLRLAVTACTEYLLHERQRRQGNAAVAGRQPRHINHLPARASLAVAGNDSSASGSSAGGGSSSNRSSPSPVADEQSSRSSSAAYNGTPPTSIGSAESGYFEGNSVSGKPDQGNEGVLATEPRDPGPRPSPGLTSRVIESHVPGLIAASSPSLRRKWLRLYADGADAPAPPRKDNAAFNWQDAHKDCSEQSIGPLEVGWFSRRIYDLFCEHAQTHQRLSFGLSASAQPWFRLKQGPAGACFAPRDDDDEPIDDEDIQGLVLYWGEIDSVHDQIRHLVQDQLVASLAPPALRAPGWTRSQLLRTAGSTPRDILDHRGHVVSKSPDEQYVSGDGSCLLSITEVAWHGESVRQLLDLTRMWRFETNALSVKVLRTEAGEVNVVVAAAEADVSRPIRVWAHGEQAIAQVRNAKQRVEAAAADEPEQAPIEVRILDGSVARLDRAWFTSQPQSGESTPRSATLDLAVLAESIADGVRASSPGARPRKAAPATSSAPRASTSSPAPGASARPELARSLSFDKKRSSESCGWADRNAAAGEDSASVQGDEDVEDAPSRRRKHARGTYGQVEAGTPSGRSAHAPSSSASSDDADLSEDDPTGVDAAEAAARGGSASRSPTVPWTSRHARRLEEVRLQLQELEAKV